MADPYRSCKRGGADQAAAVALLGHPVRREDGLTAALVRRRGAASKAADGQSMRDT